MRISASGDLQNIKTLDELSRFVTVFCGQVQSALNGRLSVTDNLRCQIISVTFAISATTYAVPHTLDAVPVGYVLIGANSPLSLYDGAVPSTRQVLYLQSSATGVAKVMVLA